MRTAIIDADSLVYQAALGAEYEWEVDDDLWLLWSHLPQGIARLEDLIYSIQEVTEADRLVMALTDYSRPNWRLGVMPTYKQHRKKTRRPIIWRPLREYLEETAEVFIRPTLEGDDVCGILMTHRTAIKGEKVCVSLDKDMKTVPGLHYSLRDANERGFSGSEVYTITEAEADRFHMIQALAGDAVDGFPGCPGWGMRRAATLLEAGRVLSPRNHAISRGPRKGEVEVRTEPGEAGTDWEIVLSAYRAAGRSEAEALMNARVARICRASDYNTKKKEVRLWTPHP